MKARNLMMLLCCMMLVLLAACGGGGNNNNSSNTGSNAVVDDPNSNEKSEAPPEDSEATTMDFDMGGRVLKLVSWYDESIKDDNPDNIKKLENLEALKKKHNFNIEYVVVDYGELKDKAAASMIAGEPLGDIIRLARPWMIPSLVKQDLFWPLDEYVKNDNAFRMVYTQVLSAYEGKGYGMRIGVAGASNGILYNKTLMNQLGIKPLQDYVDAGTWNWDTFVDVAKSANRDTDNDGKLDVWGLATASVAVPALASNDADLVHGDKQALDDPKTVETFNFLSRLGTENVARASEGGDWTEPENFFKQGTVLLFPGHDYQVPAMKDAMPDVEVGFLPFPKGPSADQYHTYLTIPNYYTIPKAIKNPEQIVYIMEKIQDIESIYEYPRQADLESFFTDPKDIENARMINTNMNLVTKEEYFPTMPYYEMTGELRDGVSVSTVIEKYKANVQAAIDEVYNK